MLKQSQSNEMTARRIMELGRRELHALRAEKKAKAG